ncbi:MAG: ABC transporter permease [Symbiobacteriaceae bacterium]|nr:ABC transporter permease [Symbiobacteriaceae bacterium]
MIKYAAQNFHRWRKRHLAVILLIALSLLLNVLYSSMIKSAGNDRFGRTDRLVTKYFDVMIHLLPGDKIISPGVFPVHNKTGDTLRYIQPYSDSKVRIDEAREVVANSRYGRLLLLGLTAGSGCYNIPPEEITGRRVERAGEIMVPQQLAKVHGLKLQDSLVLEAIADYKLSALELTIVGFYPGDIEPYPCLVSYDDAAHLSGTHTPNRLLIDYYSLQHQEANIVKVPLDILLSFLGQEYHGRTLVSRDLPLLLVSRAQTTVSAPSIWLIILMALFTGVAVLTVALMTFLERRREMASLKAMGCSRSDILGILGAEYGASEGAGLVIGFLAVLILRAQLPWLRELSGGEISRLLVQALSLSLVVYLLAIAFPVLSAIIASVNQLLFSRTIPLRTVRIATLPSGDLLGRKREQEEGVTLLKLPEVMGELDCLLLRSVGDRVKSGETLAVLESVGGLVVHEWVTRIDGEIVSLNAGGYLAIKPFAIPDKN